MKRDLPAAAKIERPGVYVLQAGSYRNEGDADRVARAADPCRESTPRCSASPSIRTSGIACVSDRSVISMQLNKVRKQLQAAEVDALVIRVGD